MTPPKKAKKPKPDRPLTEKQQAFARAVASGAKPTQAYLAAYEASAMSPAAAYAESRKLLRDTRITAMVEALEDAEPVAARISRDAQIADAVAQRDEAFRAGDYRSAAQYSQLLARVSGIFNGPKSANGDWGYDDTVGALASAMRRVPADLRPGAQWLIEMFGAAYDAATAERAKGRS